MCGFYWILYIDKNVYLFVTATLAHSMKGARGEPGTKGTVGHPLHGHGNIRRWKLTVLAEQVLAVSAD
jgi:hypothetical protein